MVSLIKRSSILLGQCVPTLKENASKIRIKSLEFDIYLNMYFSKFEFLYAHDPEKLCKTGDVVLVEKLPEKMTTLISHKILKIVYPLGDITDPITGEKISGTQYRSIISEENKLYGENPQVFDYEKAPPRGWQEDKKDFTRKPTYVKYHEFEDDHQPYGV